MADESAKGRLAMNAMRNMAIAEASAVAVNTEPASIPVAPSTLGFTARIYAMVINVVSPAITSVLTSVPRSLSLKNFSIVSPFPINALLNALFSGSMSGQPINYDGEPGKFQLFLQPTSIV